MISFENIEVKINNSGLLVDSATLSSANSLSPIYSLGMKGPISESVTGPLTSNFNISYVPEASWEPNLQAISYYRTAHSDFTFPPMTGAIAGVTGEFYLQSYNLKISPNEPNKATATYICYKNVSGSFQNKSSATVFDRTNSTGVMHGWTSIVNLSGGADPIHELDYDCRINWGPIYQLGNIYPTQVQLIGGTEILNFTRDVYGFISFSGDASAGYFSFVSPNSIITLTGVGYVNEVNNGTNFYLLDCSGSVVSNDLVATINNIAKIRTSVQKHF